MRTQAWVYPIGTVIGLIVVWHLGVLVFSIPVYLIPPPATVAAYLSDNFAFLGQHALVTAVEALGGFLLSVVVGVPVAILIVWSRKMDQALMPLLVLSQTFPKVAIAPLLIIWFGFGIQTKILVSFLIAFFPIIVSGVAGMRAVDNDAIDMIRSMKATPLQIFVRLRLPAALPNLFAGCKVAMAFAVVGAVVGEWVGADRGLGYLLLRANANLDTPMLFSILVMLMFMGVFLYYLIVAIERIAIPWDVSQRGPDVQASL